MSVQLAVADTHALIWCAQRKSKKLGRRARAVLQAADTGNAAIYVPTIALVEVLEASHHGLIDLAGGAEIAATAALLETPLITRDPEIERVAGVEVIC